MRKLPTPIGTLCVSLAVATSPAAWATQEGVPPRNCLQTVRALITEPDHDLRILAESADSVSELLDSGPNQAVRLRAFMVSQRAIESEAAAGMMARTASLSKALRTPAEVDTWLEKVPVLLKYRPAAEGKTVARAHQPEFIREFVDEADRVALLAADFTNAHRLAEYAQKIHVAPEELFEFAQTWSELRSSPFREDIYLAIDEAFRGMPETLSKPLGKKLKESLRDRILPVRGYHWSRDRISSLGKRLAERIRTRGASRAPKLVSSKQALAEHGTKAAFLPSDRQLLSTRRGVDQSAVLEATLTRHLEEVVNARIQALMRSDAGFRKDMEIIFPELKGEGVEFLVPEIRLKDDLQPGLGESRRMPDEVVAYGTVVPVRKRHLQAVSLEGPQSARTVTGVDGVSGFSDGKSVYYTAQEEVLPQTVLNFSIGISRFDQPKYLEAPWTDAFLHLPRSLRMQARQTEAFRQLVTKESPIHILSVETQHRFTPPPKGFKNPHAREEWIPEGWHSLIDARADSQSGFIPEQPDSPLSRVIRRLDDGKPAPRLLAPGPRRVEITGGADSALIEEHLGRLQYQFEYFPELYQRSKE